MSKAVPDQAGRVSFTRPTSGAVWICPGPADEMEPCSYWQSAPGWCPFHAHIDLVPQNSRQT